MPLVALFSETKMEPSIAWNIQTVMQLMTLTKIMMVYLLEKVCQYLRRRKKNKVASKAALKKGKSSSESDDATGTTSGVTPCDGAMGMKEEIILDNVCRSIQTSNANNSASAVLGTALGEFTALISESLKSWQSHQAYMNADPVLKRKYNDLLLMESIHELGKSAASRCVGNSTTIGPFSTPIGVAMLLPFHSTTLQEIIMIGWYLIL